MRSRFQIPVIAVLLACCATPHASGAWVTWPTVTAGEPAAGPSLLELLLGPPAPEVCPAGGLLKLTEGIDDEVSAKLVGQIEACKGRAITVEFDSPGGSVFAALRIQKALERHDRPSFCVVDGMAASAAFVTLQSCTYRYATDRSVLMAHHAALTARGMQTELENGREALRVVDWGMVEHCAKRLGMTHEAFEAKIANGREWYLSQADGLSFHAIDRPADSVAVVLRLAGGF